MFRRSLPAANTYGPLALNLFLEPGDTPRADLISGFERGVYVTLDALKHVEAISRETVLDGGCAGCARASAYRRVQLHQRH